MEVASYKAEELFEWVTGEGYDFTLLDVRNNEEFGRFKVEGPCLSKMINIPYIEFIEMEDESVAKVKVPKDESIRIVCAKEGSARYVGDILVNNGWKDVRILEGGIKTWGNILAPKLVASDNGYKLYQFIMALPGKMAAKSSKHLKPTCRRITYPAASRSLHCRVRKLSAMQTILKTQFFLITV